MTGNTKVQHRNAAQRGYVLTAVMAIGMALIATGIAFMRWSVDEGDESVHVRAAMQAYYLGQAGIVEKGFNWLKTRPASDLPLGEVVLEGATVGDYGSYENVRIQYMVDEGGQNFWSQDKLFKVTAVGTVRVPFLGENGRGYKEVKRQAVMWTKVRSFSDYMYLSDQEMTSFGDRIKFWHEDTLNGRVHSNSQIAIMENPVFYDQVTTVAEDFWRGQAYNPQFRGPLPLFEQAAVDIPNQAESLRGRADTWLGGGAEWTYRVRFDGGTATWYRWPTGTPFDSTDQGSFPLANTCSFFDSPLEIYGVVDGRHTIGSSYTIRLINDIIYACVTQNARDPRVPLSCDDYLGIVSEADVKIGNTVANGRENSNGLGHGQTNIAYSDIRINAAIVALGESFTFENQNDLDSGYVCTPCGCIATGGGCCDYRGFIYLYGSLTQKRRGYVHRSTCTDTGYGKQYRYDMRFLYNRPPCFIDARDADGHAIFDIVQWGEDAPEFQQAGTKVHTRFN